MNRTPTTSRKQRARVLPIAAMSMALVAFAWAQPTAAQADAGHERTFRRKTTAGQELRVFTYTEHRLDCSQGPQPVIRIVTPPSHGQASIRQGSIVSGPSRFSPIDCSGHTYVGQGVWYVPDPSFTGSDRFDYEVSLGGGVAHDTAEVEVRP
jgi:hypothetical protein